MKVSIKNKYGMEEGSFEMVEETWKNETKMTQIVYDCFGEKFQVEPGRSVVLKKLNKPESKDSIVQHLEPKEKPDVTRTNVPQRQGESPVRKPKNDTTGRVSRHFDRKRT